MLGFLQKIPNKWKIAIVIALIAFLLIMVSLFTKSEPTGMPVDTNLENEQENDLEENIEEVEVEPEVIEPEEPKYRAPLTYEGIDYEINKRPYAIYVENSPQARPQSGLDKADIVYEVLAEGGITRFVGIYQSQKPETIGPIRSAREYMLDIAGDYDAVVVHAGGSPGAMNRIQKEQLPTLSEIINGAYFKRESFRKAPHNVYSHIDLLDQGAKARGFRETYTLPKLTFVLDDVEAKGEQYSEVVIPYTSGYQVKYIYDEHTNQYHRFINNMPHNDLTTGQQLRTKNLFIAYARHNVLDQAGRLAINIQANGKGHVLQQGKVQEVTWRYEQGLMRFYVAGQEIPYYPGNTWIQVVPDVVSVSLQD